MKAQYVDFFVVRRVYDGDTIIGDLDLGYDFWRMKRRLRLAEFDAEELNDANPECRAMAEKARDWLSAKLPPGSRVSVLSTDKEDKYGRILGHVYIGDQPDSLSVQMTRLGFQKRMKPKP